MQLALLGHIDRPAKASKPVARRGGTKVPPLPLEIWLMVAEYIYPGTSDFANLARSCKALYRLLAPLHFKHFGLGEAYDIARGALRSRLTASSVPHGMELVEVLDLMPMKWSDLAFQTEVVATSTNIRELHCTWEQLNHLADVGHGRLNFKEAGSA